MNAQTIETMDDMKYIHIIAKNNVGILNRVSSLMRRRNYNMEEVSVSFDSDGKANILIAIVSGTTDIKQIISQLEKIHDVIEARDANDQMKDIFFAFYIYGLEKELELGDFKPVSTVMRTEGMINIFMIQSDRLKEFKGMVDDAGYYYKERVMNLI